MKQEDAIKVLIQVALLAQSKGVLALADAVIVKSAIDILSPKEELSKVEATKEVDQNTNKSGTEEIKHE